MDYSDLPSTNDKRLLSFKEFFNDHFYGGPNGKSSTDEQRQELMREFMKRLNSVPEKAQYEVFHNFININL